MSTSIFAGSSRYANDFQQVIDRAVAIAALPLRQLQSQRSVLNDQATAWKSVDSKFTALASSLDDIFTARGAASYQAVSSNEQVVRATVGSQPAPGTYSLEVVSLGGRTTTLSKDGLPRVTDPSSQNISSSSNFTMIVDGTTYQLSTNPPTVASLAAQINLAGASAIATVINVGSATNPDYRLSVQSTRLGPVAISLSDGTEVLLNTLTTGFAASYRINGVPATPIESNSRSVAIGPGLNVELKQVGTAEVEVQQTGSSVKEALEKFIDAFNSVVDELDTHRGQAKGVLSGQSLVGTLAEVLRKVGNYSGSGAIQKLSEIGVGFTATGKLQLNDAAFDAAATTNLSNVMAFLGGPETGGFLKMAKDSIKELQDTSNGQLQGAIRLVAEQLKDQDRLIAANEERLELLRDNLLQRMGKADALIAQLEQTVTYMNGLFEAMRARRD
ncbi:MAG: flagellar filament capping protein FliD [Bryobacterales bacterium]|nr:flagellar filament capping protein FliD [Bryobacterales bacterium]